MLSAVLGAHNARIWKTSALIGVELTSAHSGG
jgi:hypothetical protein